MRKKSKLREVMAQERKTEDDFEKGMLDHPVGRILMADISKKLDELEALISTVKSKDRYGIIHRNLLRRVVENKVRSRLASASFQDIDFGC